MLRTSLLATIALASWTIAQTSTAIRLNQIGFQKDAAKIAVVVNSTATQWELIDSATSNIVTSGTLIAGGTWTSSNEITKLADFSSTRTPGTYRIRIPGLGQSYGFRIDASPYSEPRKAALKGFYYQRAGMALTAPYAGIWARAAGHMQDASCSYHSSSGHTTGTHSSLGGWYDAGDYGKYVVNGGFSVQVLLSLRDWGLDSFGDSAQNIPESGNGIPDLLDEVRWELNWFLTMQDSDGGVFFKLAGLSWPGWVMPRDDTQARYIIGKSTTSTLNFAGVMAQASRVYRQFSPSFADSCLSAARRAWTWAKANPTVGSPNVDGSGGYGDNNYADEFFWAGAELYAASLEGAYKLELSSLSDTGITQFATWNNMQTLGYLTLAAPIQGLDSALHAKARAALLHHADQLVSIAATQPYRLPWSWAFDWGSNGSFALVGYMLTLANRVEAKPAYLDAAVSMADYLMGRNAVGYSFITDHGDLSTMHPHHRPSGADQINAPVPGLLAGGPNGSATAYQDNEGTYTENEIAINWNAPLTALLSALQVEQDANGASKSIQRNAVRAPSVPSWRLQGRTLLGTATEVKWTLEIRALDGSLAIARQGSNSIPSAELHSLLPGTYLVSLTEDDAQRSGIIALH